jgi:tagatose-1,6-bisphosphate aldolase non-catalytic subunit AgaZ/GatZ
MVRLTTTASLLSFQKIRLQASDTCMDEKAHAATPQIDTERAALPAVFVANSSSASHPASDAIVTAS